MGKDAAILHSIKAREHFLLQYMEKRVHELETSICFQSQYIKILQKMMNWMEYSKRVPLTDNVLIEKREKVMRLLNSFEEMLWRADKAGKGTWFSGK